MAYTAYRRYITIQDYNQYPDDGVNVAREQHGVDVGGGYIDYFNHPGPAVQQGFDASAGSDDEFIADGQPKAGDTELLTS